MAGVCALTLLCGPASATPAYQCLGRAGSRSSGGTSQWLAATASRRSQAIAEPASFQSEVSIRRSSLASAKMILPRAELTPPDLVHDLIEALQLRITRLAHGGDSTIPERHGESLNTAHF